MHLQDYLYRTKGKQSLQLSDATSAYLGSGDIFAQEPDELVQTESGYGVTQSQWACIVTSFGYLITLELIPTSFEIFSLFLTYI